MVEPRFVEVRSLALDLQNFRTVPQKSELKAVQAMVSTNATAFWGLTRSLIDDGYFPTENIVVLMSTDKKPRQIVKEGNRRVAALKLIHGYLSLEHLPADIERSISEIPKQWKQENKTVPCTVYESSEAERVDRIIAITHGKGDAARRDHWNAVAKARHNREKKNKSEPGLDLLESYLKSGKNITDLQRERWSGVYPLTVLDEAIKRLYKRLGSQSIRDFVAGYPATIPHRSELERLLHDIGQGLLGFDELRKEGKDFAVDFGFPALSDGGGSGAPANGAPPPSDSGKSGEKAEDPEARSKKSMKRSAKENPAAVAPHDARAVKRALTAFTPRGKSAKRNKVVALLEEIKRLKIKYNPYAFCFLLRSMFEISAKAYCEENGIPVVNKDGFDISLASMLSKATDHLTKNRKDLPAVRRLQGAIAELNNGASFLSVTSMNQLIHNPSFHIDDSHICLLFGNVFPLLEELNK